VGEDRSPEDWGVRLVEDAVRRLRGSGETWSTAMHIEGPHFEYGLGVDLFLGRRGDGPLLLAWDTNLLIDYFDHGADLWLGNELPSNAEGYGLELEAVQIVMALWVARDVRIMLLPATLSDARGKLTRERRLSRLTAFSEFASAISLVSDDEEPMPLPPLLLPRSELEAVLKTLPAGGDRRLVEQAVAAGAHVFLTRDKGVLARSNALRPFGIVIATPQDLLELLAASGALFCLLDPERHLHWPFPDLQRVTHLARATPGLAVGGVQASMISIDDR
jgi:hypothetical protein